MGKEKSEERDLRKTVQKNTASNGRGALKDSSEVRRHTKEGWVVGGRKESLDLNCFKNNHQQTWAEKKRLRIIWRKEKKVRRGKERRPWSLQRENVC